MLSNNKSSETVAKTHRKIYASTAELCKHRTHDQCVCMRRILLAVAMVFDVKTCIRASPRG